MKACRRASIRLGDESNRINCLKCTLVVVQQNAFYSSSRGCGACSDDADVGAEVEPAPALANRSWSWRISWSYCDHSGSRRDATLSLGSLVRGLLHYYRQRERKRCTTHQRGRNSAQHWLARIRARSMVLAVASVASEHHVSHHSHSCGREKMGTCICMWLGRSCNECIARHAT